MTQTKQAKIKSLLQAYRGATNYYHRSLWAQPGAWNSETECRLPLGKTRLPSRLRSAAFNQAFATVKGLHGLKKHQRKQSCPVLKGAILLDGRQAAITEGYKCVKPVAAELLVSMMTLKSGTRLRFPLFKHKRLTYWLQQPGAKLKQGCALTETHVVLWVDVPTKKLVEPCRISPRKVMGVDLGLNKLIATSKGDFIGRGIKPLLEKTKRRKPGSNGRRRAFAERDNYIGFCINRLPLAGLHAVGVEDLKHLKCGKGRRSKNFRKTLAPWVYRHVLQRIGHKAEQHGVRLVAGSPAYTSQKCPSCGTVHKLNRKGESFRCQSCGHEGDADFVGATNILANTLRLLGVKHPGNENNPVLQD